MTAARVSKSLQSKGVGGALLKYKSEPSEGLGLCMAARLVNYSLPDARECVRCRRVACRIICLTDDTLGCSHFLHFRSLSRAGSHNVACTSWETHLAETVCTPDSTAWVVICRLRNNVCENCLLHWHTINNSQLFTVSDYMDILSFSLCCYNCLLLPFGRK